MSLKNAVCNEGTPTIHALHTLTFVQGKDKQWSAVFDGITIYSGDDRFEMIESIRENVLAGVDREAGDEDKLYLGNPFENTEYLVTPKAA